MANQKITRVKTNEMLERIAAYFQARFRADPALNEIRFSSTRELCSALNRAGVNLWIFSDQGVAAKINKPCEHGRLVRGYLNKGEWTFKRHDYVFGHEYE